MPIAWVPNRMGRACPTPCHQPHCFDTKLSVMALNIDPSSSSLLSPWDSSCAASGMESTSREPSFPVLTTVGREELPGGFGIPLMPGFRKLGTWAQRGTRREPGHSASQTFRTRVSSLLCRCARACLPVVGVSQENTPDKESSRRAESEVKAPSAEPVGSGSPRTHCGKRGD